MRTKGIMIYLGVLTFSVSSCPHTGPVDVDNQNGSKPKRGYYLYVGNWAGNDVFIVDTDSNAIVDSLRAFDINIWHLAVTRSGAKLYVCTREGPVNLPGKVYSVDLKTKEVKLILNKVADVYVAPQGAIFIISKDPYLLPRQIGVIDTVSDAITFFDTLDIRDEGFNYQSIVFDKNRPLTYGVTNGKQLFSYDYAAKKVVKTFNLGFDHLQMVLSSNGSTLYFTALGNRLVVYNVHKDSILAIVRANQLGSLALSPDETYLYVTDPGRPGRLDPASGKIYLFQTGTNGYVGDIDVNKAVPFGHSNQTDRIVLMPNGKTAYVSNWGELVFVIDLPAREVVKVIKLNSFNVPMALGLKY